MKILFLLPTLDFGRDGIADYTKRLSDFCRDQGNEVELAALGRNNWGADKRKLAANLEEARSKIIGFRPDVISWQFDPRIFHPRALVPPWIIPDFSRLTKRVQLMAHETWEGDEEGASFKRRVKGAIQRRSVLSALGKIRPDVAHASSPLYLHHLKESGVRSKLLPLFSSVPVIKGSASIPRDYTGDLHLVLFGGFRDQCDLTEMLGILRRTKRHLTFHHVGRNAEPERLKDFRNHCEGWAQVVSHGERNPYEVSELFLKCHFAISTYNLLHLQKSSVYATFVDHGLPVILPRRDRMTVRNGGHQPEPPANLILPDDLYEAIFQDHQLTVGDSLPTIANQFLRDVVSE